MKPTPLPLQERTHDGAQRNQLAAQAENVRGRNSRGLVMLSLLPVARITYSPWRSA